MKMNDDFMRHFRWLTPLLLGLSIFLLQDIYRDFKQLKQDMEQMKIDAAVSQAMVKGIMRVQSAEK